MAARFRRVEYVPKNAFLDHAEIENVLSGIKSI